VDLSSKKERVMMTSVNRIETGGQAINVLALAKGVERYVFLYSDQNKAKVIKTIGRFASHPELSFTWYDAAILNQRIQAISHEGRGEA
jgi:hypothetical protein